MEELMMEIYEVEIWDAYIDELPEYLENRYATQALIVELEAALPANMGKKLHELQSLCLDRERLTGIHSFLHGLRASL